MLFYLMFYIFHFNYLHNNYLFKFQICLFQVIDNIETSTVSSQVLIRLLNKKPGIADGNIQVQKLKLECLKKVIKKFPISRYLLI